MSSADTSRLARGNHLLSGLSDGAHATLAPMLRIVDLAAGQTLHERGQPFSCVYFPTTAILSATLPLQAGMPMQIASVGNEGFSGVEMLAGADSPFSTYRCQIAGQAACMPVAGFRQALDTVAELQRATDASLSSFINQLMQAECCNNVHSFEGRFARWLLMACERTGGDTFFLPRETLSEMLSVQRQNVSLMVRSFQQAGLIDYQLDHMQVLNWQGLQEASCGCYTGQATQRHAAISGELAWLPGLSGDAPCTALPDSADMQAGQMA
jgi:CRP-like cAMP-binding protein